MNTEFQPTANPAKPAAEDIVLCGIGGAGGRILGLIQAEPEAARRCVFDTETVSSGPGVTHLALGGRLTRGLGCGGDTQHAQKIAEGEVGRIKDQVRSGLAVLIAGAGGGVGGGMSPVVARCAREAGALVVAVVIEPFDFEGGLRRHNADQCRTSLQSACDIVLRLSNQAIARIAPEVAGVRELQSLADAQAAGVVSSLVRLLRSPALVPVGFAELERWARGRQSEGVVASATASGGDRMRTLWSRLEQHPYLQSGGTLREAGAVLLHVTGGADLRLDELTELETELRQACPRAQALVGAAIDEHAGDSISGFLLAVRDGVAFPATAAVRNVEPIGTRSSPVRALVFEDAPRASSMGTVPDLSAGARESTRSRGTGSRSKAQQQQFDFVPAWTGRFDRAESTLHEGENLDEPTFVRRGVKLN